MTPLKFKVDALKLGTWEDIGKQCKPKSDAAE